MHILIAGGGHGGLIAGGILARYGYNVDLYERQDRASMGHDWEDRFDFDNLCGILDIPLSALPENSWRYRGDCAFISPAKRTHIDIRYPEESRQKVMWRKPLLGLLLNFAENNGVRLHFQAAVNGPIIDKHAVIGLKTAEGDVYGDIVIDAAGVFSPVRSKLPASFGIERHPKYGDLFYAWRGYFEKTEAVTPELPFEVYLYHNGERGLSWCCTNEQTVDILIGRIDPLTKEKTAELTEGFRREHPWISQTLVRGGSYAVIPVRRPLTKLIADGYAAVGDAAFMTTPMNGMGIDLSLHAGMLLAECILRNKEMAAKAEALWEYNRDFHRHYGGVTAKNEGLKNAILSHPSEATDFLFESGVITAADLAGAGGNMTAGALLQKIQKGMKNPEAFFGIVGGILKGANVKKLYENAPHEYDPYRIAAWSAKIEAKDISLLQKKE